MKTKHMTLGAIAVIALFAGACTAALGTPKETTVEVRYDEFVQTKNISKEITVSQGEKLIVELPSNPSTGFSWAEANITDTNVLEQNNSEYLAPEGQIVGASGKQVWTFTATGKGATTVEMQYSRPWEGGEKAEWTFEINVVVN